MAARRRKAKTSNEPTDVRPIEVAVLDRQGVIIAVNGPWTDFSDANDGNPTRTGVGMDYLEVCRLAGDEPGAREVADAITAALTDGAPSADRIHIACHAPREERWFDVLVSSRTGEAGEITGATVMVTQVPERRNDPLDADHGWAQAVLNANPDALLVADEDGVIESVNDSAERLFGRTRAELLGRTTDSVLSSQSFDPGTSGQHQRARRPDGCEIPVEVGLAELDVEGRPCVIASLRDITERLRVAERDRLIQQCIDGASDAIVVVDENSLRILYANHGAASMFGHCLTDFVETMSLGDLAPDISIARLADILGALRDDPEEPVRLWTRSLTKDEDSFEVEIQLDWPAPSSPNGPRPLVAVLRDLGGKPVEHIGQGDGQEA